jgi:hypothetical protein
MITLLTLFSALVEIGRSNAVCYNNGVYLDDIKKNIDGMNLMSK